MSVPHGTRALALALRDAGVRNISAFPGSPATVLAQAFEQDPGGLHFRWSANENNAVSHAFGAAMGGQGSAAIMKHVGVNVALDALEVMGVVHGLPAPFLVFEGADAKPGSSQSAQDNRPVWSGSMNALVLAPTSCAENYALTRLGAEISRRLGMMVVLRGDARMYRAEEAAFERAPALAADEVGTRPAWPDRAHALSTSARVYEHHLEQRRRAMQLLQQDVLSGLWESWGTTTGEEDFAVLVAAHLGEPVARQVQAAGFAGVRVLAEHPVPTAALEHLCTRYGKLLVLEECLPHLEQQVRAYAQTQGHRLEITGRREWGDQRQIGWLSSERVGQILSTVAATSTATITPGRAIEHQQRAELTPALARLSELGAEFVEESRRFELDTPPKSFASGDHRVQLFEHLRGNETGKTFITTDPGVTGVLALCGQHSNVKMHMGGGVPMAAGWSTGKGPSDRAVAVVGDTNLPHSEWLGILESAALADDLLIVIADNGYSEMTQRIVTARPSPEQAQRSLEALGVKVWAADTRSPDWRETLDEALAAVGPRLVWMSIP